MAERIKKTGIAFVVLYTFYVLYILLSGYTFQTAMELSAWLLFIFAAVFIVMNILNWVGDISRENPYDSDDDVMN